MLRTANALANPLPLAKAFANEGSHVMSTFLQTVDVVLFAFRKGPTYTRCVSSSVAVGTVEYA